MENSNLYDETPTQLIPKMGEFPVSNSAFYKQLALTGKAGTAAGGTALTGQLDPFARDNSFEEGPAIGVLLTFEQGWFQEGLALGELRRSLCLAPGEVTKLAVVDWRRDTRSQETSATTQAEAVQSQVKDASAAVKIQNTLANEVKSGMSLSSGSAQQAEVAAQGGFLFWNVSASAGFSAHQGFAATSSTGRRNVAAAAAQNIERRTEQLAQSTRSVRSTQIREVTENEQQSTTTRVVANYNHAHALTMQYYEVLQIYSLRTRVVKAKRCVFIPMKPFEFTKAALAEATDTVIELLRRVLRELGAKDVDEMVGDFHSKAPNLLQMIAELEATRDQTRKRLDSLVANKTALEERRDEAFRNHMMADRTYRKARSESSGSGDLLLWEQLTQAEAAFKAAQAAFIAAAGPFPSARRVLNQELAAIEAELAPKRNALRESDRLFAILDQHRVLLNQQMWMRIDAYIWRRKLAGTTYPDAPYEGQPIGGLVDPTPLGYFGNYVAFAWNFPQDGKTGEAQAEAFEQMYTKNASTRTRIALPTEGVFAEAVLGQSNSAEKIDITRFWNWGDSPIPILPPSMTPVDTQSRARAVAVPAPLNFAPAQAVLQEAGVLPDVINNALGALQTSIVGDNAELIAAAATAGLTASKHAAEGAGRAGQRVVDAMKNAQDFTVGLANSEVAKIATQAVISGATASASSVGGLLNAAGAAGNGARAGNGVGASGKVIKAAATDVATRVADLTAETRIDGPLEAATAATKHREEPAASGSSPGQADGPAQPGLPAQPGAASVSGQTERDAPRTPSAPRSGFEEVYKPCDVFQGFNYERDQNARVGFLTRFTINGIAGLKSDILVKDPVAPETDIAVFAVLHEANWRTGKTHPVQFAAQVSTSNKRAIDTALLKEVTQVDTTFTFCVYEYDAFTKKYYKAFHTGADVLKGRLETNDGDLLVAVGDTENTSVRSPENYTFICSIVPGATRQELHLAVSETDKFVEPWGVEGGEG